MMIPVSGDLQRVIDRLTDYYTYEEIREWLCAKNDLLDGQRAINLINDGRCDEVLAVIDRLDNGAYL